MATKVIAEIGCNHMGQLDVAHEMIITASMFCKVDAVKFQKRHPKELLRPEEYYRPHPTPHNSYGDTYGAHREYLELDAEQHRQLKAWSEEHDLEYSVSVWDLTSAREILALQPNWIKVPSACNLNRALLRMLIDDFPGQIHLSFGMTSQEEEKRIVALFEDAGRARDLIIYSCTSGYPVDFEDVGLLEIPRLEKTFGERVGGIGFSGHHRGVAVDVAAVTLGARYVERHFTLDRTWKGTDHAASLEPDGMRKLARDIRAVELALARKREEILPVEQAERDKLKAAQVKW